MENNRQRKKNGFNLIELIIVVAIIGILAAVIFVVAGPARTKAKDNRIISDLYQLQNLAENIYMNEGDYDKVDCTIFPEVAALCEDVDNIIGQPNSLSISNTSSKYCAYADLSSSSKDFCVDSFGFADKTPFAGLCDLRNFCSYSGCPDTNNNGWVECGFDPPGEPIIVKDDCPAIGSPESNGSDLDCSVKCSIDNVPACGIPPCVPCPDIDGDGKDLEDCLAVYDFDSSETMDISDVQYLIEYIGKWCD